MLGRRGRKGHRIDTEERRKMQNLTVQGTGASGDGFQEFVLNPPSGSLFSSAPFTSPFLRLHVLPR